MTIAIIGTGVAGLGAAYALSRFDDVELFEASASPGGHVNTVPHGDLGLDTGFIVHNERNYPNLTRLFREIGVETQPAEMSFSMSCGCGLEWSSRRPWRAGPKLLREILRFLRTAGEADVAGKSFDRFVRDEGYTDAFRWHYLVPMTAALWSTAPGDALEFPASAGIEFFRNHSMLGLRRSRWRTVRGGSRTYVEALLHRLEAQVHLRSPVTSLARTATGVEIRCADGVLRSYDGVVVATSAPRALALLEDPSGDERRMLSAFEVTANETVLHTDARFLPRRQSDRSSWNYQSPGCGVLADAPSLTYSLNRLQKLDAGVEYCVTLNRTDEIDETTVIRVIDYEHPKTTFASLAAAGCARSFGVVRRTAFAGAWQGNGFHEDGLDSGLRAAEAFGASA
ncbi:MAG: FAD-dependent oxidoreductase [Thermoleophilia bacterium]